MADETAKINNNASGKSQEELVPETEQSGKSPENEASRLGPDGKPLAKEVGGRKGPEPTRYGDWENNGIISDF